MPLVSTFIRVSRPCLLAAALNSLVEHAVLRLVFLVLLVAVAAPGHDEIAHVVHRHRGVHLVARQRRVDQGFGRGRRIADEIDRPVPQATAVGLAAALPLVVDEEDIIVGIVARIGRIVRIDARIGVLDPEDPGSPGVLAVEGGKELLGNVRAVERRQRAVLPVVDRPGRPRRRTGCC